MLKPRNQRIHTDYSKQSKSAFPSQPLLPPRRKSTMGYHPESYISTDKSTQLKLLTTSHMKPHMKP